MDLGVIYLLLSAFYTGLSAGSSRHGEVLAVTGLPLQDAVNLHIARRSFMRRGGGLLETEGAV